MRIKRYEASTIQEALMKVKKDLGPEAVILYTKTFRKGGMLGFFGKPMAEITAGIDLNLLDNISKDRNTGDKLSTVLADPSAVASRNSIPAIGSFDPAKAKVKALQRELNEMKISSNSIGVKEEKDKVLFGSTPETFLKIKKKMIKQEVEDVLIQKMINGMVAHKIDPENHTEVANWISDFVESLLRISKYQPQSQYQRIIVFVGPTGVGKTTTLAKLAARFCLMEHRKIVLVTADTYRIAATEQLKTYGRIMGIPVEVANSDEDMQNILQKHKNADLVLLDTAGRSPSNEEQLLELKRFITSTQVDEVNLVLSATTKYYDMIKIIEKFGLVTPINRMIFTKLDETRYYGAILNLMVNFQIPLSYYSTGQNVPDDLEVPEANILARKITEALIE